MLLKNQQSLGRDLLASLENPEVCDIRIESSEGGEIPANKTILGIRSEYFSRMFSPTNNFVERSTGLCKLSYPKAVVMKVVIYLYSGEMDVDDLALGQLLDLLSLLDLMNLTEEFNQIEKYAVDSLVITPFNINNRKFPDLECLTNLEKCFAMRMETIGEALVKRIGNYIGRFCQLEEVGLLSETMIIKLLQVNKESELYTTYRLKTFVTWLSTNSMDDDKKDEVLETFDFVDFTVKELASVVRTSGLYSSDRIIERMGELDEENWEYIVQMDDKDGEICSLEEKLKETKKKLEEKSAQLSAKDQKINQLKQANDYLLIALKNKRFEEY